MALPVAETAAKMFEPGKMISLLRCCGVIKSIANFKVDELICLFNNIILKEMLRNLSTCGIFSLYSVCFDVVVLLKQHVSWCPTKQLSRQWCQINNYIPVVT